MSEWTLPEWRFRRGRHPKREDVINALEARVKFKVLFPETYEVTERRGRVARHMYLFERKLLKSNRVIMAKELSTYLYWRRMRNGRL